ncbi:hypothetical protein SAMN05216326_12537 [Nitrosomonas marina]|uniref:Uncharacterized protein n=1 Tax=Nitrosomonas marina TaxID=917 RepID=A0A1I0E8V6_9PROT|nr:hypothetical protein SAMN05216326_12537 [Nitrosomonas marina]
MDKRKQHERFECIPAFFWIGYMFVLIGLIELFSQ